MEFWRKRGVVASAVLVLVLVVGSVEGMRVMGVGKEKLVAEGKAGVSEGSRRSSVVSPAVCGSPVSLWDPLMTFDSGSKRREGGGGCGICGRMGAGRVAGGAVR